MTTPSHCFCVLGGQYDVQGTLIHSDRCKAAKRDESALPPIVNLTRDILTINASAIAQIALGNAEITRCSRDSGFPGHHFDTIVYTLPDGSTVSLMRWYTADTADTSTSAKASRA